MIMIPTETVISSTPFEQLPNHNVLPLPVKKTLLLATDGGYPVPIDDDFDELDLFGVQDNERSRAV